MSIDVEGIPRVFDDFGAHRISRAKRAMLTPLHQLEPGNPQRPSKAPATGIFASITDSEDVNLVTEMMFDFLAADEDKTEMRVKERQAACESGFRRMVELCNKNAVNQMRWIGEHNENLKCDHDLLRKTLNAMDSQSICMDADHRGASSQNRGCEVACVGLQFLMCMLQPTGHGDTGVESGSTGDENNHSKSRRLTYRDAWFTCRAAEVVVRLLERQGACNWFRCQKKAISNKVAEHGVQCLFSLIVGSAGNTGYALSVGALEAVDKCLAVHGRTSARLRKHSKITLEIMWKMKNDPAYNLEVEAQRLKIIAEQPGATTEDRVAAAKAEARVQVVKMDRK
jgi:hypothetical protein